MSAMVPVYKAQASDLLGELGLSLIDMMQEDDPALGQRAARIAERLKHSMAFVDGAGSDLAIAAANMAAALGEMAGSVSKGNPEFRPDQARDNHGRWTVGGGSGVAAPRTPRSSTPRSAASSLPAGAKKAIGQVSQSLKDLGNSKGADQLRASADKVKTASKGWLETVRKSWDDWWAEPVDFETKMEWVHVAVAATLLVAAVAYLYFFGLGGPIPTADPDWFQWLWQRMPR